MTDSGRPRANANDIAKWFPWVAWMVTVVFAVGLTKAGMDSMRVDLDRLDRALSTEEDRLAKLSVDMATMRVEQVSARDTRAKLMEEMKETNRALRSLDKKADALCAASPRCNFRE